MAGGQKTRVQAPKLEPLWEWLQQSIDWYDNKGQPARLQGLEDHHHTARYRHPRARGVWLHPRHARLARVRGWPRGRRHPPARRSAGPQQVAGELGALSRHLRGPAQQQHLFAEKAGPYADLKPEIANRVLAERTSSLVMAEHSKWVHARSEKTETTTGT